MTLNCKRDLKKQNTNHPRSRVDCGAIPLAPRLLQMSRHIRNAKFQDGVFILTLYLGRAAQDLLWQKLSHSNPNWEEGYLKSCGNLAFSPAAEGK